MKVEIGHTKWKYTKKQQNTCLCLPVCITVLVLCCFYPPGQSIKMFIRGRPITMYIPSNIQNYEDLKMEPPTERLELDWVYPTKILQKCSASFSYLLRVCYIQTVLIWLCAHFLDSSHRVSVGKYLSDGWVPVRTESATDELLAVKLKVLHSQMDSPQN